MIDRKSQKYVLKGSENIQPAIVVPQVVMNSIILIKAVLSFKSAQLSIHTISGDQHPGYLNNWVCAYAQKPSDTFKRF